MTALPGLSITENGKPVWKTAIPAICQLFKRYFAAVESEFIFRQIVNAADDKPLFAVEIGTSVIFAPIELIARNVG